MSELPKLKTPYSHDGRAFYDDLEGDYDQMMDWESRLQKETPFFQKLIHDYKIGSVIDIACGTGRHCFHFETFGIEEIVGIDPSVNSLTVARRRTQVSGSEIQFLEGTFLDAADRVSRRFGLVCTLGNSISHLLTYDELEMGLRSMRRLMSEKGVLLVHLLNWDARLNRQERFFAPRGHSSAKGEKLFFRFFDFHDELVTMNLAIFESKEKPARNWTNRIISTRLRPWRREILLMALKDTGLQVVEEYGGMDLSPFHPHESNDYVFIARKEPS